MIQVQPLLLRGLCASVLVFLVGCSGTQPTSEGSEGQDPVAGGSGNPGSGDNTGMAPSGSETGDVQDPRRQQQDRDQQRIAASLSAARKALQDRLYTQALNEALFVLEFDSNNEEARAIFNKANAVLGESDEVVMLLENQVLKARYQAERERYRARSEMQQAEANRTQGRFGLAEERYENALRVLRYSLYIQADDPLRTEAERLLAEVRQEKRDAIQRQEDQAKTSSDRELAQQLVDQRIARDAKVTRYLVDANEDFQLGNYAKAVDMCNRALALQPTNERARDLRDLADRARHETTVDRLRARWRSEWQDAFQDLQQSDKPQTDVVVFDIERWATVKEREPETFTPPEALISPEARAIRDKLDSTVLEHRFTGASVQDWARWYSNITEVTFYVTSDVADGMDAEATTLNDFSLPRMSVARALSIIQDKTGVAWTVKHGMVHLVSPENAGGPAYLAKYDVRDLVSGVADKPGPELKLKVPGDDAGLFGAEPDDPVPAVVDEGQLEDLIRNNIATDAWDDTAFLTNQNGVLLIRADSSTQEEVAGLLNDLRRHVGIQVDVEARFLKVEDNFLEDVGVDFRGLGNQAAEGVAGRGLEQNNRNNLRFDDFGQTQQINPASPGSIGTGTEPGFFFDDGQDGDIIGRTENLFDNALGVSNGEEGLTNAGGLSLQYAFLDDMEVEVVLRAVAKQERSEQIEAPRLLVYNNTRSSMSFLRNISYIRDFEVEIAQAAAVANPVVDVVRDGVALDVRPVVDADLRFITMELRPTVMTLQLPIPTFTTTLGVGQPISIQLPRVTLQRVRTTVTMPDGGTMMLGGMKLAEKTLQESGIPVLKDLPLLGFFFSRKGQFFQNRKIIILLRAKIIIMDEQLPDMTLIGGR